MKTVAVVPMKLNNQRLPSKNTKAFTNGKPLCNYILTTLKSIQEINEVYVYCSNPEICEFIPEGIKYLKRGEGFDTSTANISELLLQFAKNVPADIYVLAHVTAPFTTAASIRKGIRAVAGSENDSAFAVKKIQDFLWKQGKPFNYSLDYIPRTQDLEPIYMETTGLYIYKSDVIQQLHRRIGNHPYMIEVTEVESIDIDELEDFQIADAVFNHLLKEK